MTHRPPYTSPSAWVRAGGYVPEPAESTSGIDYLALMEESRRLTLRPPPARGTGAAPASPFAPTPLAFDGEPDTFFAHEGGVPYEGQDRAVRRLDLHVRGLRPGGRLKGLYTGPAGLGKTALARIVARRVAERHAALGLPRGGYYELLPDQVKDKALLDQFMDTVAADPYAVVFIDEVHALANRESLFHTLHDTGAPRYPRADGSWLDVPATVSWFAATTDPGLLEDAVRRRLEPEVRLEAPGQDVLARIIAGALARDGLGVHPDAAYDAAARVLFPSQAKLVARELGTVARAAGAAAVEPAHAAETFDLMGLDAHGLFAEDRDVLAALLRIEPNVVKGEVVYKMSEAALCAAAGVDASTFKQRVQPKLLRTNLLQVRGGQALTAKALREYGHLRDAP